MVCAIWVVDVVGDIRMMTWKMGAGGRELTEEFEVSIVGLSPDAEGGIEGHGCHAYHEV